MHISKTKRHILRLSEARLLVFGSVALVVFSIVHPAAADFAVDVINAITSFVEFAFVQTSSAVLEASAKFLGYVMSPSFNALPLTHGGVVDVGWELTRQMANLFIIFFLIVFSFMSLLDIDDKWQLQKLVPRLIILAILLNFTKVIAGVVVDASQILMNFFISGGSGQQLSNAPLGLIQSMRIGDLFSPSSGFFQSFQIVEGTTQHAWFRFGSAVFQTIFQILTSWILGLIALIFMLRVVAIWVLVILAPIAFLMGMLPGSSGKYFNQWWQYLIQWSFVGAFAMFFVYLAAVLAKSLTDNESVLTPAFTPPPGFEVAQFKQTAFLGDLGPFLIYVTIFVFLAIGYNIAKNTAVIGAEGIIKYAAGQQEKFAKFIGKKAFDITKQKTFDSATSLATTKYGQMAMGALAAVPGLREIPRALGKNAQDMQKRAKESAKNFGALGTGTLKAVGNNPLAKFGLANPADRLGMALALADKGGLSKVGYSSNIGLASRLGLDSSLKIARPHDAGFKSAEEFGRYMKQNRGKWTKVHPSAYSSTVVMGAMRNDKKAVGSIRSGGTNEQNEALSAFMRKNPIFFDNSRTPGNAIQSSDEVSREDVDELFSRLEQLEDQ